MSKLDPADFAAFFGEVYKDKDGKSLEPFPWQVRLAERVCNGGWPKCIALPTAAGKTACIDIAVFALACQADRPPAKRTAPRRVFFVVDRRVIVDQAYEHAKTLSQALANAQSGVLNRVANALRNLGADEGRPLDFYALRGGIYRESAWVRSPLQPTIITSTVDQIGSRLLFRGYGVSDSSKPLHAALVGNDALILLDEAHCARPFDQTMTLVEKYRGWAEKPLPAPFHFVTMTATPSNDVADSEIERDRVDDHAHPVLGRRMKASKPATLAVAKNAKGATWRANLVRDLVKHASSLKEEGFRAVGIIVNRVATARETAAALKGDSVDVILLTGRMRPMDRDAIMTKLEPLFSGKSAELSKPTFVVATQCLEVGADLDFHTLVTECASLDALRQRFGRLNRVAARDSAKAVIVIRADQTEPTDDAAKQDPVYGNSLAKTWLWLHKHANDDVFDFRVAAVGELTRDMKPEELAELNAPSPDAAVLLPAHLDCWVQTSPIPAPDPDPAVFLHGPSSGVPDVQVVFRADLVWDETKAREENKDTWAEIVSLCPPSSSEALSVRLDVFKRWLVGDDARDESSDVEGDATQAANTRDDEPTPSTRRALLWKGPDSKQTDVIDAAAAVRPGDLYVVSIAADANVPNLGDFPDAAPTDQGDEAFQMARDRAILRLTPTVLNVPALAGLTIDDESFDEKLSGAISSLNTDPREWVRRAAESLGRKSNRVVKPHPLGGFVVIGRKRLHRFDPTFVEAEESWDAVSDRPYPLTDHCQDVALLARRLAEQSGVTPAQSAALESAGLLHDCGKADPRFQAWLHGGNRRKADLYPCLLAKSLVSMPTREGRADARKRSEYPEGGRHELLSVRLAESNDAWSLDPCDRDLLLHLIASHHGFCRPFAPIVDDPAPLAVEHEIDGHTLRASSATGLERLDSGVAERFWKLTRRFGWWGVPWLESMLRLADWACSERAPENFAPGTEWDAEPRRATVMEGAS